MPTDHLRGVSPEYYDHYRVRALLFVSGVDYDCGRGRRGGGVEGSPRQKSTQDQGSAPKPLDEKRGPKKWVPKNTLMIDTGRRTPCPKNNRATVTVLVCVVAIRIPRYL